MMKVLSKTGEKNVLYDGDMDRRDYARPVRLVSSALVPGPGPPDRLCESPLSTGQQRTDVQVQSLCLATPLGARPSCPSAIYMALPPASVESTLLYHP